MKNTYKPEGMKFMSAENREYLYSSVSLEKAMVSGKILEAPATMCDSSMALTVDLGVMDGIMEKDESALSIGDIKDIAVITRVGKPVCFKILSIENRRGAPTAFLSRREAQRECMENYVSTLLPGDIIDAKVTHLEPFGAFVDIGCGIISLMSIDSISVSRISHPKDRFRTGMFIKAVVKSADGIAGRLYVSHKELLGSWKENVADFRIGQTVAGTVRSIEPYGIFVELTPNLAGLAEYRDDISVGDIAAVYIKNIIPEKMKVKLVIVDSQSDEIPVRQMNYYETGTHISEWRYSPEECPKVINTVFDI
ncbi:MAG: 30S ribosomal protein S1 [Clostridia bacterium]|nr:30S ribosomal protein S1 [Clostridia bacterium]